MAQVNTSAVRLAAALLACCLPFSARADSTRATMDAGGNRATFTGLARVTCFDDGGGPPALLTARVRDNSEPLHGLMVNLQLQKGTMALNISDEVSGDAGYSQNISLAGGKGEYLLMVNKTAAGIRNFDLEWHCMTLDNVHTGTDIGVLQFK